MEFFILLSKIINEQGGKLRAGWKENLKNLSEHALLLGTSEYLSNLKKPACAPKEDVLELKLHLQEKGGWGMQVTQRYQLLYSKTVNEGGK